MQRTNWKRIRRQFKRRDPLWDSFGPNLSSVSRGIDWPVYPKPKPGETGYQEPVKTSEEAGFIA